MATPRLTFLYPHLFRSIRAAEHPIALCQRCLRPRNQAARITTSTRNSQQFARRAGKGVEPEPLQPGEVKDGAKAAGPEILEKFESSEGRKTIDQSADYEARNEAQGPDLSSNAPLSEETQAAARIPGDIGSTWVSPEEKEKRRAELAEKEQDGESRGQTGGDTVLHMDPPREAINEASGDPPHLVPPPFMHHFDSYTLVKRLEEGGFSPTASIEAMKLVRGLLAENLDLAQDSLVSKSDVENETYLFQAACSELRTEVQNARRTNDEQMRMQRTILQHEVEILNQKLTQDLASLKDDLRGMFNDRKMEVRMEQRNMESAIQQLNYKITVDLNSDSKSEVEGVRWILTRRSVLAIVFMAVVVLSSLRLASYRSHEAAIAQKKAEKQAEEDRLRGLSRKEGGTQTEETLLAAEGLVST